MAETLKELMISISSSHLALALIAAVLFSFFVGALFSHAVHMARKVDASRLKAAKENLEKLRQQIVGNSACARHILEEVREGLYSVRDLQTSTEELADLGSKLAQKECALQILSNLRSGRGSDYRESMAVLPRALKGAGLTLSDVGSSDAEFAAFPRQIAIAQAKDHWERAFLHALESDKSFALLRRWMDEGNLKPVDFGASEGQYQMLAVMFEKSARV